MGAIWKAECQMKIMGIGLMERALRLTFLYLLDCPVLLCRNNTDCRVRTK